MSPNRTLYLLTLLYGMLLISLYFFSLQREMSLGQGIFWQLRASYNGLKDLPLVCVLGAMLGACSYLQGVTSLGISGILTFLCLPVLMNSVNPISKVQVLLYGWTSLYGFSDSVSLLLARKIGRRKDPSSLLKYLMISALASSAVLSLAVFVGNFDAIDLAFPGIYFLLSSVIGIPLLSYMKHLRGVGSSLLALSLNVSSFIFALIYRLKPALVPLSLFISPFFLSKLSNGLIPLDVATFEEIPFNPVGVRKKLAKKRLALSVLLTGLTWYLSRLFFLISFIGLLGVVLSELSFFLFVRRIGKEVRRDVSAARALLDSGDVENCILLLFPCFIRFLSRVLGLRPHELRSIGEPQGNGIKRLIWAALNPSEATRLDAERIILVLESTECNGRKFDERILA